jgi:hypothetical protein
MLMAVGNSVHFYQLSKINILVPKLMNDRVPVGREAIGSYLKSAVGSSTVKFLGKLPCIIEGSAPKMPCQD